MIRIFLFSVFYFLFFISIFAQGTFPVNGVHDYRNKTVAFINATIHQDSKNEIVGTLIIENEFIIDVGKNISIPKNAIVLDLTGKHIYPSFIELISEYGIPKLTKTKSHQRHGMQQFLSNKKGAYSWNEALRSEYNAVSEFTSNESQAKELRKMGFGMVLSHRMDGIAEGTGTLVSLGKNTIANNLIVNEKAANFLSFSKGSSSQNYPSSLMGSIALLRQTYLDGLWYKSYGHTQTKNLSLKAWNENLDLVQIFRANDKLDILRANKIAEENHTKYIIQGIGNEYQRINEISKTNSTLIVPVNFPPAFDVTDPYDALLVSLTDLKHWELAHHNLRMLDEANIQFAITSSDLKNKKDFLPNIRKTIANGFSREKALDALTSIPASLLGQQNQLGKIKKGFRANLIITSDDIFLEKSVILENWIQGQSFFINEAAPNIFGEYNLFIENDTFKIKIESPPSSTISIAVNDSTNLKVKYQRIGQSITMSFILPNEKNKTRLSGTIDSASWHGEGQDQNGQWFKWKMNLISKLKLDDPLHIVQHEKYPEVIFPFVAYGQKKHNSENNYLIQDATVWTNEKDGILKDYDVLIKNGKISKIEKNIPAIRNYRTIDGEGKFLTAGIIDEHSHIAVDRGINECTQAVTAEVRIGDILNSEDINIYRQLAGGVTTSQILHGSCNPIGGQSALIKLKWGESPENLKFENAIPFIKFALGENVKKSRTSFNNRFPDTRMGVEQVYRDAFTRAKEYKIRKENNDPNLREDLEMETLLEILDGKRNITCHSYVQSEINMLMHVAEDMGFKVNTFTHILEGYKIADKLKKHGAGGSTFSDWWAYKYEVIDAIPFNAAILTNHDIITAINSDDPEMGRRLNQEAAKSIKYGGLSEIEAWKLVTLNPAKLLHIDDRVGSIKIGKNADLVLWSNNPLSIKAKAEFTFIDGEIYYERKENINRKKRMEDERNRIIQKMLRAKQNGAATIRVETTSPKIYHCDTID